MDTCASSRPIKSTPAIVQAVKQCLSCAEISLEDKRKFERELDEEYVSLEFIKYVKKFCNENATGYDSDIFIQQKLEFLIYLKRTKNISKPNAKIISPSDI
jgi:hypothetical protein